MSQNSTAERAKNHLDELALQFCKDNYTEYCESDLLLIKLVMRIGYEAGFLDAKLIARSN